MTKPLSIFLELVGFFYLINAFSGPEFDSTALLMAATFIIAGGIGIRKRLKGDAGKRGEE